MSSGDQTVEVTLRLSKDRYEQIRQARVWNTARLKTSWIA